MSKLFLILLLTVISQESLYTMPLDTVNPYEKCESELRDASGYLSPEADDYCEHESESEELYQ